MTCTFVVPIALLSLFPHQEPRFIIPVLFPLVFLYAPDLSQVPCLDIVRFNDKNDESTTELPQSKPGKLTLWYVSNLLLAFFYAFAHQGGVFLLTSHIRTELKAKPHLTHVHLYTSYSYSLPTALLQLRNTRKVYRSSSNHKYKLTQDFHLYEQGSKPLPEVFDSIVRRIRDCEEKFAVKRIPYRLYYALPASAINEFVELSNNRSNLFRFHIVKTFYPHISIERLPSLRSIHILENMLSLQSDDIFKSFIEATKNVYKYIEQFRLLLLKIEYFLPEPKQRKYNEQVKEIINND